jgi:hypothetical protein
MPSDCSDREPQHSRPSLPKNINRRREEKDESGLIRGWKWRRRPELNRCTEPLKKSAFPLGYSDPKPQRNSEAPPTISGSICQVSPIPGKRTAVTNARFRCAARVAGRPVPLSTAPVPLRKPCARHRRASAICRKGDELPSSARRRALRSGCDPLCAPLRSPLYCHRSPPADRSAFPIWELFCPADEPLVTFT